VTPATQMARLDMGANDGVSAPDGAALRPAGANVRIAPGR
jgi:hypothetical protein